MHQITLLSSFHRPLGKCNPTELYKIIESIKPEIIFEELSKGGFNRIYSHGYQARSVEAIAIKEYLRVYPIKHFPVDTYSLKGSDLFSEANLIAKRSPKYVELWNRQVALIAENGYDFLNSDTCVERLDEIQALELATLTEINNAKLTLEFQSENALHRKREDEMLKNIYHISQQNPYNKAMFICGAEHRKPLIQKIEEYQKQEDLKLTWKFY